MEIKYVNEKGEELILKQRKPFFLTRVDGTGRTNQIINTFKAPGQDGAFFISSAIDMRNITIEGVVVANSTSDAYEFRKQFLRAFTLKLHGTLYYRNRQISCVVEEAGFIDSNRERSPNFFVSLLCPSPFFETPDSVRVELAMWTPLLEFALEIPNAGIEFGSRQPSQIITVDNIGDVSCGCTIEFKAQGTVLNPELMNLDTGEYIRMNTTLTAGERLLIYTHFAGKRVHRFTGNTSTNAFSDLDIGSSFLQLEQGRNLLRYDASSNLSLLEVSIYYRPQFLGV